jgi:FlaA1/EpsC-like NDP-sugar epimerase
MPRSIRSIIGWIHPRIAVVIHDLLMVAFAWYLAKAVRLSIGPVSHQMSTWAPLEIGLVLAIQGSVLWWTGLYRGLWRFASLQDLWNIARASVVGSLLIASMLFIYDRSHNLPRSVMLLYPILLTSFLGGPRLLYRFWKDSRIGLFPQVDRRRVLVLGAGRAGEMLVRDLKRQGQMLPVGFLDDNRALRGARVHDVPVLGTLDDLAEIAPEVAAEMLLIAMPSASSNQMRRVVELCEKTALAFRMVPRLEDVVAGRSAFNVLKEVAIEDLLGREAVQLDWTAIREGLSGKRILITGGGGSIGSELCRQAARLGSASISIVDISEFNLYKIERDLRHEFEQLELHAFLGDITDPGTCQHVFETAKPEVVFHAAAFKHVPMLQNQVREAFRNNVQGTQRVAQAADQFGVHTFVLISTDKAVNPANVMGASKRIAEMFCQGMQETSKTKFITVRFGNVLDSAGSVVPLFREQIRRGGPVTVTHPEIARYFMTIPEACQLILQAAVLGQGGEIFALDMGEPVQIRYLAEQMILLAGKIPGRDIEITYTGLREGEKLFEELFHEQEEYVVTKHAKIFLAQHRPQNLPRIGQALARAKNAVTNYQTAEIVAVIEELVPEFSGRSDNGTVVSITRAESISQRSA